MSKILKIIIVTSLFSIFVMGMALNNTKTAQGQTQDTDVGLSRLEERIDILFKSLKEKDLAQISGKLDQVISNQNKIISELEIVKVRASHR